MKFFKFELDEYMDEYPTTRVRVFNTLDDAKKWADYMTRSYSGGTTTLIGELSNDSAREYVRSLYNKEIDHRQDDSREFILKVEKDYAQCYPDNEPIFSADEIARL